MTGFGINEGEENISYKNYMGEYVSINIVSNGTVHGKLVEVDIKDGNLFLNPYFANRSTAKLEKYTIIDNPKFPRLVQIDKITDIDRITNGYIERLVKGANAMAAERRKESKNKSYKKPDKVSDETTG